MSTFFKDDVIRKLASSPDQAQTVRELVGDALNDITLTGNDLIMSVYIEKEMSPGGLILPPERLRESLYQSKVGLVLKTGPESFQYRGAFPWITPKPDELGENGKYTDAYYDRSGKYTPKNGDWVIHFASDSRLFGLNGVPCRYATDSVVKMITTKPSAIL
jgi:hypothetical protein